MFVNCERKANVNNDRNILIRSLEKKNETQDVQRSCSYTGLV